MALLHCDGSPLQSHGLSTLSPSLSSASDSPTMVVKSCVCGHFDDLIWRSWGLTCRRRQLCQSLTPSGCPKWTAWLHSQHWCWRRKLPRNFRRPGPRPANRQRRQYFQHFLDLLRAASRRLHGRRALGSLQDYLHLSRYRHCRSHHLGHLCDSPSHHQSDILLRRIHARCDYYGLWDWRIQAEHRPFSGRTNPHNPRARQNSPFW